MENKLANVKIVAGLGNPDAEYKNTYHNAGKLFTDYLAEKLGIRNNDFKAHYGLFEAGRAGKITLVRPLNYMNENGRAIKLAIKLSRVKAINLFVAHDDSDIEVGDYKISFGSGSAGHRGVQSVIESIGTKNFWRLRIGIRPTGKTAGLPSLKALLAGRRGRRARAGEFVLKKIPSNDKKILYLVFEKAAKEILSPI